MFTLRCTQKLLKRLRLKPVLEPPPSTTRLGDWYADGLNLGRERLVLCVSERTLLPVVFPGIGVDLSAKLARGLRETLEALGVPAPVIETEVHQLLEVAIAKTASRTVLGSMNDFQIQAHWSRQQAPQASLLQLGLNLAEAPCGPIQYATPKEATLEALGVPLQRPKPRLAIAPPPPPEAAKSRSLADAGYEDMVRVATLGAEGEAARSAGWHRALLGQLRTPFETRVLGVVVRVERLDLSGDGSLVAVCRRGPHRQTVPLLDLPMPTPPPAGAAWLEAYRRWKR
jgi:hypothetical protein